MSASAPGIARGGGTQWGDGKGHRQKARRERKNGPVPVGRYRRGATEPSCHGEGAGPTS